jgi:hypothetical protein
VHQTERSDRPRAAPRALRELQTLVLAIRGRFERSDLTSPRAAFPLLYTRHFFTAPYFQSLIDSICASQSVVELSMGGGGARAPTSTLCPRTRSRAIVRSVVWSVCTGTFVWSRLTRPKFGDVQLFRPAIGGLSGARPTVCAAPSAIGMCPMLWNCWTSSSDSRRICGSLCPRVPLPRAALSSCASHASASPPRLSLRRFQSLMIR